MKLMNKNWCFSFDTLLICSDFCFTEFGSLNCLNDGIWNSTCWSSCYRKFRWQIFDFKVDLKNEQGKQWLEKTFQNVKNYLIGNTHLLGNKKRAKFWYKLTYLFHRLDFGKTRPITNSI